MTTLLITHPACLEHETPPGHPERPDRLRAVARALADDRFKPLVRVEAPRATFDTIALCHPLDYVDAIRDASPKSGMVRIDADTSMSPGTFEASLRAVGGILGPLLQGVGPLVIVAPPALQHLPWSIVPSAASCSPVARAAARAASNTRMNAVFASTRSGM